MARSCEVVSEPGAVATGFSSGITNSRRNPVATAPGSDKDLVMAIGWGKSYEEQMEEASQRASEAKRNREPRLPVEDRVRLQQLESLKLSRSRVLAQLERASLPAHREMLMKALQAIEKETDEISQPPDEEA
jgi:hypothetical protein